MSTAAPAKRASAQSMMGAKNHCVVLADANKEQAINNLIGAAFGAAGQRCMANSVVVLVGEARSWLPEIVARSQALKVGRAATARPTWGRWSPRRPCSGRKS
jgi:acyl-CoA reductase-like NAD-dependent aldehyde dehydrogenase